MSAFDPNAHEATQFYRWSRQRNGCLATLAVFFLSETGAHWRLEVNIL
jgi:hypothetical protein